LPALQGGVEVVRGERVEVALGNLGRRHRPLSLGAWAGSDLRPRRAATALSDLPPCRDRLALSTTAGEP
jgi:hypothetical protein